MAAGSTYTPIATYTASGSVASYDFTSVPSTYTDLVLVVNCIGSTFTSVYLQFNSDTTSVYSRTVMDGNGTSATSDRETSQGRMRIGLVDGSFGTNIINIQNYANTTTYKTVVTRGSAAADMVRASVGLWQKTNAISTITVGANSGTFSAGTTMTLYGITAA